MTELIGKNVLVTTANWFTAPNGRDYKAAWGELKGIHEAGKALGFIPNRAHANWFLEVGNMVIMGCQVMYVIQSEHLPNFGEAKSYTVHDGKRTDYDRHSHIYNAQPGIR